MKKIILILLLFVGVMNAQSLFISTKNTTVTALDSAATFTGTAEMVTEYNYITILIRSNISSATNGIKIKMGNSSTSFQQTLFFSYVANDTTTNRITIPLSGKYFQITYTNGTTDQTTFNLTTYLHKALMFPIDASGNIKTTSSITTFPSGLTYANIRDSFSWARIRTVFADSVRTDSVSVVRSRDTVTITATEWAKVTMSVAAGDSVSFAIGTTAPSNYWEWHTIRNGETFVSEKLNFTYFTKVFIKGAGYPDHIESYQCIIEAF